MDVKIAVLGPSPWSAVPAFSSCPQRTRDDKTERRTQSPTPPKAPFPLLGVDNRSHALPDVNEVSKPAKCQLWLRRIVDFSTVSTMQWIDGSDDCGQSKSSRHPCIEQQKATTCTILISNIDPAHQSSHPQGYLVWSIQYSLSGDGD